VGQCSGIPDPLFRRSQLFHVFPAAYFVFAADHAGNGLGICEVLFREDPRGERVFVVGLKHRDRALHHDCAVIELFIDKVYGAARDLYAVGECLLLRFKPRERGQKRGMNVENAMGEGGDKLPGEEAHVAGQANQIHAVRAQAGNDFGVMLFALAAARLKDCGRQAKSLRGG